MRLGVARLMESPLSPLSPQGPRPARFAASSLPSPQPSPSLGPLGSPLRPRNVQSLPSAALPAPTAIKRGLLGSLFLSPQSILSPPSLDSTPGSPRLWQQQHQLKSPLPLRSPLRTRRKEGPPQLMRSPQPSLSSPLIRAFASPKTPVDQMIKAVHSIKAPRRPSIIAKRRHRIRGPLLIGLNLPPEQPQEPTTTHLIRPPARRSTQPIILQGGSPSNRLSTRAATIAAVLAMEMELK